MNFKITTNQVLNFFKKNARYFFVFGVFIIAIFYSQLLLEVGDMDKNKDKNPYGMVALENPSLDNKQPSLDHERVMLSQKGDFYRIRFNVIAEKDEVLIVEAISESGASQYISELEINGTEEEIFEKIFSTDGNYETIRISKKLGILDNELALEWTMRDPVYISKFNISRLGLNNAKEVENLKPTVFGETTINKIHIGENEKSESLNFLSQENARIGWVFRSDGDHIAFIEMNLSKIGTGGVGKYKLNLHEYDGNLKKTNKLLKEISFSSESMVKKLQANGNFIFEFAISLEKEKEYYLSLNNKKVRSDKYNYLKLNKLNESDEDVDNSEAYFSISTINFSKSEDGNKILTNSRVEDLGNGLLIYQYEINKLLSDYFDIIDHEGDMKFDWDEMIVKNRSKKRNYYTYKIDTIYPFEKMRLLAVQDEDDKDEIKIEYSYDNKFWKTIDFSQDKSESQEFDFTITDNAKNNHEIYLKVSYDGDKDKKKDTYGLKYFKISAYLNGE